MSSRDQLQWDISMAPVKGRPHSRFNHSHRVLTPFDSGYLIPIMCKEVYPGDVWYLGQTMFVRLSSSMKQPVMDNIRVDTHYFYVPNRMVWEHWINHQGEKLTPADTTEYTVPKVIITQGTVAPHSIYDYMGVPPSLPAGHYETLSLNALGLRAYNRVWNDYYRDQDLIAPVEVDISDNNHIYADFVLLKRAKKKDYFTSCRQYPQAGTEQRFPIGTQPGLSGDGNSLRLIDGESGNYIGLAYDGSGEVYAFDNSPTVPLGGATGGPYYPNANKALGFKDSNTVQGLSVDYTDAMGPLVSDVRLSLAMQHIMEIDQRSGHRYIESLLSQWGVVSSDKSMWRPLYLGGSQQYLNISTVAANTAFSTTQKIGDLGAFGSLMSNNGGFTQSFEEHGIVLGLISIMTENLYQNGLDRMWSRTDRWSYYMPELSGLSEQAVLKKELYLAGTSADEEVFGYQESFADLRYSQNRVCGVFRSNMATSLDVWHLGQDLDACPALDQSFVEQDIPIDRCLQVTDQPQFFADISFDLNIMRTMPVYNVPGLATL